MPQRNSVKTILNEADIQLAIQAIQRDASLTTRRAGAIYSVSEATLRRRLARTPQRRDCAPNLIALRGSEEIAIVKHVLKLVEQGYPPRLADVEEMASSLLEIRNQKPVSKN